MPFWEIGVRLGELALELELIAYIAYLQRGPRM